MGSRSIREIRSPIPSVQLNKFKALISTLISTEAPAGTVTQVTGGAGLDGLVTTSGSLSLSVITMSGATQVAAGAAVGELWYTVSHATLPDGVVMRGL